ncbi:MAG: hypothetical protein CVT73_16895 [Alphaproteobacteria bacterium HGW-Alphaproteobacteria-12]|nr:MAG: hypothetical protein CVT73_16895 [Alphaproteobacteria bacterium HGW-Alphaproteobacteria-12]
MGLSFDTLGYSERLQAAGASKQLSDEHARLARDMIIADLVTREDLRATRDDLKATLDLAVTRQTIIFGGMLAAAVAIGLAAIPLIV